MKAFYLILFLWFPILAFSQNQDKPNILIIWGEDIGKWDIIAYHRGMMGNTTPNIDRITDEGMREDTMSGRKTAPGYLARLGFRWGT